jgi:ABC-type sugar transport system substrate-binding protein
MPFSANVSWTIGVLAALSAAAAYAQTPAPLKGDGREIVLFSLSDANTFVAKFNESAAAEAKRLGYGFRKIATNDLDQTSQDANVRQYISSGAKPAAVLFFPVSAKASVNSARLLSQIAPVIQVDNPPLPDSDPFITAVVLSDHVDVGARVGKMLMEHRAKLKADGVKLNDPRGNLLIMNVAAGSQVGIDRTTGIKKGYTAEPLNLLAEEHAKFSNSNGVYELASTLVPKYKGTVDYIYTHTTNGAVGAVKALKENGLVPGKNVWVIAGNCAAGWEELTAGTIVGTHLHSPQALGQLSVVVAAQFLATNKVTPGRNEIKESPTAPEFLATPPSRITVSPSTTVRSEAELKQATLWGVSGPDRCPR